MFRKTVEAPTLGFLLKKKKKTTQLQQQKLNQTKNKPISNGGKRSKVGSDWENGMHKTV